MPTDIHGVRVIETPQLEAPAGSQYQNKTYF